MSTPAGCARVTPTLSPHARGVIAGPIVDSASLRKCPLREHRVDGADGAEEAGDGVTVLAMHPYPASVCTPRFRRRSHCS